MQRNFQRCLFRSRGDVLSVKMPEGDGLWLVLVRQGCQPMLPLQHLHRNGLGCLPGVQLWTISVLSARYIRQGFTATKMLELCFFLLLERRLLLVSAGISDSGVLNKTFYIDVLSESTEWTELPDFPEIVYYPHSIVSGGKLFMCGDFDCYR